MSFRHTPNGERRHRVTLQNPTRTPDDDGGYTVTWTDCTPATVYAAIAPMTARELERATQGTVITQQTHVFAFPFHPQVTEETRIVYGTRTFSITGVTNPEYRNVELQCACVEVH